MRKAAVKIFSALLISMAGWGNGLTTTFAADVEQAQYNAAVSLYNAGQWQAALSKIDERLRLSPPDAMKARYLLARAMCYDKGGRSSEARKAYGDLLSQCPQSAEAASARLALVYLAYAAGDMSAVSELTVQIKRETLSAEDRRNLLVMSAEAAYARKEWTNAFLGYQGALSSGADRKTVGSRYFDLALRLKKYSELIALTGSPIPGVAEDVMAFARMESFVTLQRYAEAQNEAQKIPSNSVYFARAAYIRAQALIQAGRLKDAVEPLDLAIRKMREPAAPPAAVLALAECQLAAGQTNAAWETMEAFQPRLESLPESEKTPLRRQAAAVRIRLAAAQGNSQAIIRAVDESRDVLPPDQQSSLLYLRLHALFQRQKYDEMMETYASDYPLLKNAPEDGPATLLYAQAFKKTKRLNESLRLLDEFIQRKPQTAEAVQARIELARVAIEKEEWGKARPLIESALSASQARAVLGSEGFREAQFNQAVAAFHTNLWAETVRLAEGVGKVSPSDALAARARILAGQVLLKQKDYAGTIRNWSAAIAGGHCEDEAAVREQLGAVMVLARDYQGADGQFQRALELRGSKPLEKDSQVAWSRALYGLNRFADAASRLALLYEKYPDTPAYAYEAALALERAGQFREAEKTYVQALDKRDRLPSDYAAVVEGTLARLRSQHGLGDGGLNYWASQLDANIKDEPFMAAWAAVQKTPGDAPYAGRIVPLVEKAWKNFSPDSPRYYLLGALFLEKNTSASPGDILKMAIPLAENWSKNEKQFTNAPVALALAPAIIFYHKGDALRRTGDVAAALADFETVLAAYPVNEWPDAAACGAAECYAALGDTNTAMARLLEVVTQGKTSAGSRIWSDRAKERLDVLKKGGR